MEHICMRLALFVRGVGPCAVAPNSASGEEYGDGNGGVAEVDEDAAESVRLGFQAKPGVPPGHQRLVFGSFEAPAQGLAAEEARFRDWQAILYRDGRSLGRCVEPATVARALPEAASEGARACSQLQLVTLTYDHWQPLAAGGVSPRLGPVQQLQLGVGEIGGSNFSFQLIGKGKSGSFALPLTLQFSGREVVAAVSTQVQKLEYVRAAHRRYAQAGQRAAGSDTTPASALGQADYTVDVGSEVQGCSLTFNISVPEPWLARVALRLTILRDPALDESSPAQSRTIASAAAAPGLTLPSSGKQSAANSAVQMASSAAELAQRSPQSKEKSRAKQRNRHSAQSPDCPSDPAEAVQECALTSSSNSDVGASHSTAQTGGPAAGHSTHGNSGGGGGGSGRGRTASVNASGGASDPPGSGDSDGEDSADRGDQGSRRSQGSGGGSGGDRDGPGDRGQGQRGPDAKSGRNKQKQKRESESGDSDDTDSQSGGSRLAGAVAVQHQQHKQQHAQAAVALVAEPGEGAAALSRPDALTTQQQLQPPFAAQPPLDAAGCESKPTVKLIPDAHHTAWQHAAAVDLGHGGGHATPTSVACLPLSSIGTSSCTSSCCTSGSGGSPANPTAPSSQELSGGGAAEEGHGHCAGPRPQPAALEAPAGEPTTGLHSDGHGAAAAAPQPQNGKSHHHQHGDKPHVNGKVVPLLNGVHVRNGKEQPAKLLMSLTPGAVNGSTGHGDKLDAALLQLVQQHGGALDAVQVLDRVLQNQQQHPQRPAGGAVTQQQPDAAGGAAANGLTTHAGSDGAAPSVAMPAATAHPAAGAAAAAGPGWDAESIADSIASSASSVDSAPGGSGAHGHAHGGAGVPGRLLTQHLRTSQSHGNMYGGFGGAGGGAAAAAGQGGSHARPAGLKSQRASYNGAAAQATGGGGGPQHQGTGQGGHHQGQQQQQQRQYGGQQGPGQQRYGGGGGGPQGGFGRGGGGGYHGRYGDGPDSRPPSRGPPPGARHGGRYDGPGQDSSHGPSAGLPPPDVQPLPDAKGSCDLDRFLSQTQPMIALDPAKPWQQALQGLTLRDLWAFFFEPSINGREVFTLGGQRGASNSYFVPYLSAMQLFTPALPTDVGGSSRLYVSEDMQGGYPKHMHLKFEYFEQELPFNRLPLYDQIQRLSDGITAQQQQAAAQAQPQVQAQQPAVAAAAAAAEVPAGPAAQAAEASADALDAAATAGSSASGNAAEPAEAGDAAVGGAEAETAQAAPQAAAAPWQLLYDTRLLDLHPASWFAVAWYPVYRIPDAPLYARFLTFHSFGPLVQSMANALERLSMGQVAPYCLLSMPAVGIQWYNMQGERWMEPLDPSDVAESPAAAARKPPARLDWWYSNWIAQLQGTAERLARGSGLRVLGQHGAEEVRLRVPDFEFFRARG